MNRQERVEKVITAALTMQRWPWEQGTLGTALQEAGEHQLVILFAKEAIINQCKDGRLAMKTDRYAATDPASNGVPVLYAYKVTGDIVFKNAADRMLDYLIYRAPKTREGILYHNENEGMVWVDSYFMAPPFLAYAEQYDEALKQIWGMKKILWNEEHQLFSHMWDDDLKKFERKAFWGVGNGWAASGIARVIRMLPDSRKKDKVELAAFVKSILDGCIRYQREDFLFYDVIDDSSTFVETNLPQMLAYTIYSGVTENWLDSSYIEFADKYREAVYQKVDEYGLVQGVCSTPNFDRPGTATEGQAFFILMEAAYDKYLKAQAGYMTSI